MGAPGQLAVAALGAAAAVAIAGAAGTARAAPGPGEPLAEPALVRVEEAAARRAAGPVSDEVSRVSRARAAHWAPVLRGQYGIRDDDRTRRGQIRQAPLLEDDLGQSRSWALVATWDLAQVVYARDEAQLALAHVHLARVRQETAGEAVRLFEERWRLRAALRFLPAEASRQRVEALLALLRCTADLDALTGGLYAAHLAQAEEQVAALEPQLRTGSVDSPGEDPSGALRKQSRRAPAAAPRGRAPEPLPAASHPVQPPLAEETE